MEVCLPLYEDDATVVSSEEDDCAVLPSSCRSVYEEDDLRSMTGSERDTIQVIDTTDSLGSPRKSVPFPDYIGNDTFGSRYLDSLDLHDSVILSPRSRPETIEILGPGVQSRCTESDPDIIRTPEVPKKPRIHKAPSDGERLLARREFHRGCFVRFRYPSQFHQDNTKKVKQQSYVRLPQSFQPQTRYGKEPKVLADRSRKKPRLNWPRFPVYPPKARHAETMCEIIRMVQTLDIGIQSTPPTTEAKVQCQAKCTNTSTQYPVPQMCNTGIQTDEPEHHDAAIQNVPIMKNKMEETSVRILYFPEVYTQHMSTQTGEGEGHATADKEVKATVRSDTVEVECQTECVLPIVTVDNPEGVCSVVQTFT